MKVFIILSLLLTTCAKAEQSEAPVANPEEVVRKQLPQDETVDIAVAATKYQAREDLTKAEYDALRQPVPDWDTFNRLVRVEDGFDDLRRFYLDTNTVAPNLNWLDIVYYDPQKESYYYGKFKPTNIEGFDDLINTKKNPAHQVYGRDRVVLITNLTPSTHIYADAYNDYQLYALELKSTVDEYGIFEQSESEYPYFYGSIADYNRTVSYNTNDRIVWRAKTNHSEIFRLVSYYVLTNGTPVVGSPIIEPYNIPQKTVLEELTTINKKPVKTPYGDLPYSEETKEIYYGIKYGFYGDIAQLTNTNPPVKSRYIEFAEFEGKIIGDAVLGEYNRNNGVFWQSY